MSCMGQDSRRAEPPAETTKQAGSPKPLSTKAFRTAEAIALEALRRHQGNWPSLRNPPPVIRAPGAPWVVVTSTATSSSAQEISKSSRIESCEALNTGPTSGRRPALSTAPSDRRVRSRSRRVWLAPGATSRSEGAASCRAAFSQLWRRCAYCPSTRLSKTAGSLSGYAATTTVRQTAGPAARSRTRCRTRTIRSAP
ncbi:MAG: hypothetical protein QOE58_1316 [Actinomycetota bacterium]|nr:hypothetical protein [Actinomycetota bacterium]